jgi:hypothetical protein
MAVDKNLRLGATASSANDLGNMGALTPILGQLAGGSQRGQMAADFARQLYPEAPKADPYEAALRFFIAMGQGASQPGATVLSSAVGAMQAPADYLAAKKKEKRDTDRARIQTAVQLAPSLKPPAVTKAGYTNVMVDGVPQVMTPSEIQAAKAAGKTVSPYEKPSAKTSTFKERKFFRTGFDPVVVKNETDAASFEADPNWSSLPPADWVDSKGETDEDAAEVQASSILDGGVVVTVMKDGTTKVLNAAGVELEGDARAEAIREAEERGIEIQAGRAGGRRAATVAVNTSLSAFDQVGKSRSNIANLEEAKRLVVEEGANTGVIADRLPNWKASTVALDTVKNELGLDVVGSVTFGALSQGELTLALNTALPTNLSEDALVDWIDRKIEAQRKLQDYLYAQAIYLSDGDKTIGDWLRSQKAEKEERERIAAERRQAGTDFDFSTMPKNEILEIDIDTLDSAQFEAWEKRMDELGL